MKRTSLFSGLASASLLLVSCALGGDGFPGYAALDVNLLRLDGGGGLLRVPAVQKELKLSKEQSEKLTDLVNELQATAAALAAGKKDPNPPKDTFPFKSPARPAVNLLTPEQRQSLAVKGGKAAAELLTPEQFKRVQQIRLQSLGLVGLAHPEVGDRLKLTDEQRQSIREAYMEGRREALSEILKQKKVGTIEVKMKQLDSTAKPKIMAILTEEQRRGYAKMVGQPVDDIPHVYGTLLNAEPKKDKQK